MPPWPRSSPLFIPARSCARNSSACLTDPNAPNTTGKRLFHIRRGSGGKGRWNAGDCTLRRTRFLRPMNAAILSGHRAVPNPGMEGGEPGELGRNAVRRNDGRVEILPGCAQTTVEAGEAIEIVTPTGGGWGKH
jgi:5-oxoprolinase (ATP-hydrolysing)